MKNIGAILSTIDQTINKRTGERAFKLGLAFALPRERLAEIFPVASRSLWTDAAGAPVSDPGIRYPVRRGEEFTASLSLKDGASTLLLRGARLDRFLITPVKGGIAMIKCAAHCKPTEAQVVTLLRWLRGQDREKPEIQVDFRGIRQTGPKMKKGGTAPRTAPR